MRWGRFDGLFTPAYWKGQAWLHGSLGTYEPGPLGRNLREEVAAYMLGGFGIGPEVVGLAAFARVKERGPLGPSSYVDQMTAALEEPFLSWRAEFAGQAYNFRDSLSAKLCVEPTIEAAVTA